MKIMDGTIFDIQSFSLNDGPGIRTTVFLKGCSLNCLWCSNPESQSMKEELLYYRERCVSCCSCVEACPNGAIRVNKNGTVVFDRTVCKACGACVHICPSEARVISGSLKSVEEIVQTAVRDNLFYRNSGGGVTLSGGEPLSQAEFVREIAKELKKHGIHCVLDTSGNAPWKKLESVLHFIDLIYWDIKCINGEKHGKLTGVTNDLIIENLEKTLRLGKKILVRFPLIPGCNDSRSDIEETGNFLRELGIGHIDVLPYHNLGVSKYKALDKAYHLGATKIYKREEVEEISKILKTEYGLSVSIV
ncbi:MAG: glycyl-radical enzyme activating protein [Pseudomonadota bacterium]